MESLRRRTAMSIYSNNMKSHYSILDRLNLEIEFTHNPYGFQTSELFEMGARVNPKRNFLFVSKLIGKHLDVDPDTPMATGHLLADLLVREVENISTKETKKIVEFVKTGNKSPQLQKLLNKRYFLNKPTLFIGFAETATGLGHAVFSAFDNTYFVHTTREEISNINSVFDFEEEHSHATDHRCYLKDANRIKDAEHIVLVDDEITTGKTSINLIRALHQVYPKKEFSVLALLDWRTESQKEEFLALEKELEVKIRVISLTQGKMTVTKEAFFEYDEKKHETTNATFKVVSEKLTPVVHALDQNQDSVLYPIHTGRFGLSSKMNDEIEESARKIGEKIQGLRKGNKTLILGSGEFMYIPSRIASHSGSGVTHKSTTRSPIYPVSVSGYPIHERIQYVDDAGVNYYAYNLKREKYDEVFFLSEKSLSNRLLREIASELKRSGIDQITFLYV